MSWDKANDKKNGPCNKATEAEGFIQNVNWHLPSPDEFAPIGRVEQSDSYFNEVFHKNIKGNDIFTIPEMNFAGHFFWSSSAAGLSLGYAWGFYGNYGIVDYGGYRDDDYSVRCVAR